MSAAHRKSQASIVFTVPSVSAEGEVDANLQSSKTNSKKRKQRGSHPLIYLSGIKQDHDMRPSKL